MIDPTTLAMLGELGLVLGAWWVTIWFYVTLYRTSGTRELLTLRLETCARLQLPMTEALTNPSGAPKKVAQVMRETSKRMQNGEKLSEALDKRWAFIPWWYTRTIAIGETTGNMTGALSLLTKADEREEEKRLSYLDQLFYPFALFMSICTLFQGIFIFILPKFLTIFRELEIAPTPIQTLLMKVANILVHTTPFIMLVFAVLIITIMPFPWGPRLERYVAPIRWGKWLLRRVIPGLSNTYFRAASARWASVSSLLLKAGLPLHKALREAADVESDCSFRKKAKRWARDVSNGESLSATLSKTRGVSRPLVWQIQCAEGGAQFPEVLRQAAEQEISHLHNQVGYLFAMMSPFFIVAVGALVALIAVGVFQYFNSILYSLV